MDAELLSRLREELEEERRSAVDELREYGAEPDGDSMVTVPGVDDNFADLGQATAERSEAYALIEQTRGRLAEVDAALAKMDEGTYGVCVDCGASIPEARLEARPLSVRCLPCAEQR